MLCLGLCASAWSQTAPLRGYSADSSRAERDWEAKFRAVPDTANLRAYMQRLSARPHHVGSPYDKDNAEWILAKLKEWGLDAKIETFDVLFPTPKERALELVEPSRFTARLVEPAVPGDPTSSQRDEQLPTYNAYSIDGNVTAPLVYVNYGVPEDYETLDHLGVSVKGALLIRPILRSIRRIRFRLTIPPFDVARIAYICYTMPGRLSTPKSQSSNQPARRPLMLWRHWWRLVCELRSACARPASSSASSWYSILSAAPSCRCARI
jgi:hypothetical protein